MRIISALFLLAIMSCHTNNNKYKEAIGDDELGNLKKRSMWFESIHRAAPGTNWRAIEKENALHALNIKNERRNNFGRNVQSESFANGLLVGTWSEKGVANIAGSNIALDYDAPTNNIYTISAGGSLWRGSLAGNNWSILNDDIIFENRAIKVFNKNSGGRRMLLCSEQKLYWSDNEGATINPSNGIVFPVPWGGNYIDNIVVLNDPTQTVYVLTHNWDNVLGWSPRHYLFRSVDGGLNFTRIHIFSTGNDDEVSITQPYNSNLVFVSDVSEQANKISLYEIAGSTVTAIPSTFTSLNGGNSPLVGVLLGNTLTLYLLQNNKNLSKRVRVNAVWSDWTFVGTTATDSWGVLDVSTSNANNVYYGEVDAFRSNDGGTTFTRPNFWYEYYGNVAGKLHADMMEMKHFKKTDNTVFQLVNNHGGMCVSYDNLITTTNLTLTGFNNSQSYDILTDTLNTNNLYSGTQDQGMQYCNNALTLGILNFDQVISGDYGYLAMTENNRRLWAIYPGQVCYWYDPFVDNNNVNFWDIPGTNIPNYGWMPPLKSTNNKNANEVYVAGGNLSGGDGSYLIKVTATSGFPYTLSQTQLNYNFRQNSNNGTSNISAIGIGQKDVNNIYIAAEDGTFFYSSNNGVSWNKTSTFNGTTGWYLYGQTILTSKITNNLLWYGGSGYSNPGVFKSTNGGVSFTAINNGLPQTLIHELAANNDETLLFAATDAGPYVYVVAQNLWYPMIGINTPSQMFTAVEYVRSINTIRFATHGRGILDFKINATTLPVNGLELSALLNTNKTVTLNWNTKSEINNSHFEIEKSADGQIFSKTFTINAYGNGNSSSLQSYNNIDAQPFFTNFYRVKQFDKDGKFTYSKVVKVNLKNGIEIILAPNPVIHSFSLSPYADVKNVMVYNINGQLLKTFKNSSQYDISDLASGSYIVTVATVKDGEQKIKLLKQ
jgi:hypothetical protein